jgi:hypothetical protein
MAKRKESATVDIKIRMKEPLRAEIEKAATRRGVSMNAEMVDRLERSFSDEAWASHVFEARYGKQLAGVLEMVGRAMHETGTHVGFAATGTLEGATNWLDEPYAFDQAVKAAGEILEALRPPGDVAPKGSAVKNIGDLSPLDDFALRIGAGFAMGLLEAVADEDRGGSIGDWAHAPRAQLGPMAERLKKLAVRRRGRKA